MPTNPVFSSLLRPTSVAVVGASEDPLRIGGRPISYMLQQGYQGNILPVNPKHARVQGIAASPSVLDLPVTPDLAIVAVAARLVPDTVEQLGQRGTKSAIVFSAGFSEMGEEGRRFEQDIQARARGHGIRLLGPNSLGVLNPHAGFYGTFTSVVESGFPLPGRIGIVSQSGAYGCHIVGLARNQGMGISAALMSGNESDLGVHELIRALVEDEHTDVIAVYSEGIRDGLGLIDALQAARNARKPVIVMKVGTSEVGRIATQSHTASIAGNDRVFDAILSEMGVVRARSTEHMLDVARLATHRIYPVNNTLGVITVSGGAGVIISDAAEAVGLPMPEMPAATQQSLKNMIPFAAPRNPVDCTAQFMNDLNIAGRFTESVVEDGNYQSVLGFFTYTVDADSIADGLGKRLKAVRDKHPDRLFALSILASKARVRQYEDDGFTVFEDPTRAVVAIEAMGRFGAAFTSQSTQPPPRVPQIDLPRTTPSEAESKRILAKAGIAVAPEFSCQSRDAAVTAAESLGFPVVMKILSPDILHKSEIGGVLLNVNDADAVRAGFDTLTHRAKTAAPDARLEGVLVAKQLAGGVECILGIQRDPVFGPVAVFGLGGIFVEVMNDVVLRRCPFGEDVAEEMIRGIKGAALLMGARGTPPADIKALASMLARLSVFAYQAGDRLLSIDLNPVFAMPEGQGAFAADAVLELDPAFVQEEGMNA